MRSRSGAGSASRRRAHARRPPLDALERRVSETRDAGPSFASIHVQTDDLDAVERAVRRTSRAAAPPAPRSRRRATAGSPSTTTSATAIPTRCGGSRRELSTATRHRRSRSLEEGTAVRYLLLERGSVVDEYMSVPEYYGPLPPGDVVALGANPTAVARLTGADPARVRQVARTAELAGRAAARARAARRDRRGSASRAPSTATRGGRQPGVTASSTGRWPTLYDAARCPYCARVRIVLAEKGIPHETVASTSTTGPRGSSRRTRLRAACRCWRRAGSACPSPR